MTKTLGGIFLNMCLRLVIPTGHTYVRITLPERPT